MIFIKIKNVNIKFDIFSYFYRFAVLHNTQPVLLYIFTFGQRNSKAATSASLSRPPYFRSYASCFTSSSNSSPAE